MDAPLDEQTMRQQVADEVFGERGAGNTNLAGGGARPLIPDPTPGAGGQDMAEATLGEGADNYQMSPAQEAQYEAYTDNATLVVFSEKSQPQVLQLLQSGKNPVDSVAEAGFRINKQLVAAMLETGEKPTEITLCLGGAHLISELCTLASAAGLYDLNQDEQTKAYQLGIQKTFEDGFRIYKEQGPDAPGAINPVEAQKMADALLTPEQRRQGLQAARQNGISLTPPPTGLFGAGIGGQTNQPGGMMGAAGGV